MGGGPLQNTSVPLIGIDPSYRKMAIIIFDGSYHAYTIDAPPKEYITKGEVIDRFMWEVQYVFSHHDLNGAHLFVEEPVVARGNPSVTIKQAQAASVLHYIGVISEMPVTEVNNKSWKKVVVGNGNATKDEVATWLGRHHPELYELCEGDQDLIDAACIHIYGGLARSGQLP